MIEIKTLVQDVYLPHTDRAFIKDSDDQLSRALNDGWEILNLTVVYGSTQYPIRIVTLIKKEL